MNRRKFLQQLGMAGLALPVLSSGQLLNVRTHAVKIYDNYLRGLQYYNYKQLQKKIKEGDELQLWHDAENMHDSFAIEVKYANQKMGYLPAYENIVIANILDAGVRLTAFVSRHNKKEELWNRMAIEIYAELVVFDNQQVNTVTKRADDYTDRYRLNF